MQYEVTITPSQEVKLKELLESKSPSQVEEVFGSYVGNYVGKKQDQKVEEVFGGYVKTLLNTKPELHNTPHYDKLVETFPDTFKPTPISSKAVPKVKVQPQQANSKLPGVATTITTPEAAADTSFTEQPMDLQIAIKYQSLYNSASKRGIEFGLTLADVGKLLSRKTCYFTGARLKGSGTSRRTIDRLDANKGYVKGNVVACTHTANQLKNYLFESEYSELRTTKKMLQNLLKKLPD